MQDAIPSVIDRCCQQYTRFPRRGDQAYFVIPDRADLLRAIEEFRKTDYYLVDLIATDERYLEAQAFKVYYIFSGGPQMGPIPEGPSGGALCPEPHTFVVLGYPLDPQYPTSFPAIHHIYDSALPLESKIHDMFGLVPDPDLQPEQKNLILHRTAFSPSLAPQLQDRFQEWLQQHAHHDLLRIPAYLAKLTAGETVIVGPIHAKIIGGGLFIFEMKDSEVIEKVSIVLGFQHRGVEKLLETHYGLENGWELAEMIAGDASFAYGLAYCRAVENLAEIPILQAAKYWRALLLELERIASHIFDVANMLLGINEMIYGERMETLLEATYQLFQRLTNTAGGNYLENENFLLRCINHVGGVTFPGNPDLDDIEQTVKRITKEFLGLSMGTLTKRSVQKRFVSTGILEEGQALEVGATGVVARASGLAPHPLSKTLRPQQRDGHDFRLWHDQDGVYAQFANELMIRAEEDPTDERRRVLASRSVVLYEENFTGDAMARFAVRVAEVESSANMVKGLLEQLKMLTREDFLNTLLSDDKVIRALTKARVYGFGIGHAESWRGDVTCVIWKGPDNGIFRCSFRDPSVFNWMALQRSVARNEVTGNSNLYPDFPVINKSYNNSYPGVSQ